jgi:hypothetical protein
MQTDNFFAMNDEPWFSVFWITFLLNKILLLARVKSFCKSFFSHTLSLDYPMTSWCHWTKVSHNFDEESPEWFWRDPIWREYMAILQDVEGDTLTGRRTGMGSCLM